MLEKKNRSFEDFLAEWLHGSFPIDEAGILIIARAYKIHVAVFFNEAYWTTNTSENLQEVKVFLLYRGNLVFEDSRRMSSEEFTARKQQLKKLEKYYGSETNIERQKRAQDKMKEYALELRSGRKRSINCIESESEDESESDKNGNIMPSPDLDLEAAMHSDDEGDSEKTQDNDDDKEQTGDIGDGSAGNSSSENENDNNNNDDKQNQLMIRIAVPLPRLKMLTSQHISHQQFLFRG